MVRIKDTQLVETVAGTWLRFPDSFKKFHCLVELPGQLTMNINSKSGSIHIHKRDSNNVYQPCGELSLSTIGSQLQAAVYGIQAQGAGPLQPGNASMGGYDKGEPSVRKSDAS
ncbi:hypothetical protein WMW72_28110 [Paenibacillus filicis]|uniref:Uncharacterized protein n=1 Tax=Paenibacillus filicis TaxID=669464 RepID=A0ABU9DSE0_9BACL